jgi:hypothetical protein
VDEDIPESEISNDISLQFEIPSQLFKAFLISVGISVTSVGGSNVK